MVCFAPMLTLMFFAAYDRLLSRRNFSIIAALRSGTPLVAVYFALPLRLIAEMIASVMTAGGSFRDKKDLIDVGYFKAERLVDMSNHNYSKTTGVEPNGTFTPDGKWIIFSGNFHTNPGNGGRAITHVYAVEIAKH